LFIFQLYCYIARNRDVLLTILFPVAIIFLFIIGIKRFFTKSSLKENDDDNEGETTQGETAFRILFLLLNLATLGIYVAYWVWVPSVAFREIKLSPQLVYRETNNPGEFRPIPVQYLPDLENINAPDTVNLVSTGSMNPAKRSAKSSAPQTLNYLGQEYTINKGVKSIEAITLEQAQRLLGRPIRNPAPGFSNPGAAADAFIKH
jgi:hypothetical protein